MKTNRNRVQTLIALVVALVFIVAGCAAPTVTTAPQATSTPAPVIEKLEYSIFLWEGNPFTAPKVDLVADAMKTKWEVTVTDWSYEQGQNWSEKLNLFVTSKTLPDIFEVPGAALDTVKKFSSEFVDLTPYLSDAAKTPNLHKYMNAATLKAMQIDGKNFVWPTQPSPDYSDPDQMARFSDELIRTKSEGLVLMAREDVLKAAGYTFTSRKDLEASIAANPRRLTYDDIKLTPEIKSIEDLNTLFEKVKALNLKAPDGTSVITYGGKDPVFALGPSYAFDFARKVDGTPCMFYGSPFAKDMFKQLNLWMRNGIMDKSTYILKDAQLTDEVALGHYALWDGGWIPDEANAEAKLTTLTGSEVRYITYPRFKADVPQVMQALTAGTTRGLLIRKDYKDIDKLVAYLDWLYSDEAQEMAMWGAETNGVWKIVDGKKVFKDEALHTAILGGKTTDAGEGANYFGLFDPTTGFYNSTYTRGVMASGLNPYNYKNSYPVAYQVRDEMIRTAGEPGIEAYLDASMVISGSNASKLNDFFWGQSWNLHNKMVLAKTDAEFEKNFQEVYDAFMASADYAAGMKELQAYADAHK